MKPHKLQKCLLFELEKAFYTEHIPETQTEIRPEEMNEYIPKQPIVKKPVTGKNFLQKPERKKLPDTIPDKLQLK